MRLRCITANSNSTLRSKFNFHCVGQVPADTHRHSLSQRGIHDCCHNHEELAQGDCNNLFLWNSVSVAFVMVSVYELCLATTTTLDLRPTSCCVLYTICDACNVVQVDEAKPKAAIAAVLQKLQKMAAAKLRDWNNEKINQDLFRLYLSRVLIQRSSMYVAAAHAGVA